jgi:hypothetical protein
LPLVLLVEKRGDVERKGAAALWRHALVAQGRSEDADVCLVRVATGVVFAGQAALGEIDHLLAKAEFDSAVQSNASETVSEEL